MLITGASEGIGAACARALRAAGARLALNGRSREKLSSAAGLEDLILPGDLTGPGTPQALIDRTLARFGRLDILINNAGHGVYRAAASGPDPETRALFDLNFFAPLALAQAAIPVFRKQRSGMIVNVGSIAGDVPLPWMPLYSASKAALASLTRSLRTELAPDGIAVLLVSPGYVLTDFHQHSFGLPPPPRVVAGKRFAITPDQCAAAILAGISRRSRSVITPPWGSFFIALHRLFPTAVEAHLMQLNQSAESA